MIACAPEEPRFIGHQDLFKLQEAVIADLLKGEQAVQARSVIALANDPIQQSLAVDLKDAMRRQSVDRERAKALLPFLSQPVGKSVVAKLKAARADWSNHADDRRLLDHLERLQADYAKSDNEDGPAALTRDDLHLVCFEFLSS